MENKQRLPEVVISGISGRFPESSSVKEFISNLLKSRDLVTSNNRRFKSGLYGLPKGFGTLKEIDRFDGDFFGFLPKQVEQMDPQLRIGLETTYEAIFDAGINPVEKRGSRTGVFTAIISHEALDLWSRSAEEMDGANLIGSLGTMLPNRISYCFDFHGPSASYDTACSSSIFALDAAVTAIQTGRCDAAVVMGACLILNPTQSLMRHQAGMLAKDSVTKTFDPDGLGYVRAEAVASIYLQKKCDAKKAYASIVGIGCNTDGYKDKGIFNPSATMQQKLMEEVYLEAGVDPAEVTYVEAHGTGTPAGDPEEVKAISRHFVLNRERTSPLLIGSVKSNMGHAEGASGLCSIAKIVGIIQHSIIPGNIHYGRPHFNMKNVRNGTVEIVDKNRAWNIGDIGINCFGFGGVNTHVILKPFLRHCFQDLQNSETHFRQIQLHDLVTFSGRTRNGVEKSLNEVIEGRDRSQMYLLNEINRNSIKCKFRGFGIVGTEVRDIRDASTTEKPPPVWFILNGMGSQWIGMGRSLIQIPAFEAAFDKCCNALLKYNYDLRNIYMSDDPAVFESPTNTFTSIGVTQIGLVDILRKLGIKPDGMLGHSMGETLCAYVDGCMTLEETIVSIYLRGQPCEELCASQVGSFGMAVVPLGATETATVCPDGVVVACHNGPNSTTISGPTELIAQVKATLESQGIEVKDVNSCGLAFHSDWVTPAANKFVQILRPLIRPRARSSNWISTSIPENTEQNSAKMFGPEYLHNNFVAPVLFTEALQRIPQGAVVIEIGPSGLLRGLIQKGTKDAIVIPLQARNADAMMTLTHALGKIFVAGINFDLNNLIGKAIDMPLPGNTPLLGHLVAWDHSASWKVPVYSTDYGGNGGSCEVCLARNEDSYLAGHILDGKIVYPAAGYLSLVWRHFAASNQSDPENTPVIFEDVKFLRATILKNSEVMKFNVNILKVSGNFEVTENDNLLCTGKIHRLVKDSAEQKWREMETVGTQALSNYETTLTSDDVYKRLRFLSYQYTGDFKGIQKADLTGLHFLLHFNSNWVTFIDAMFQTTFRIYSAKDYPTDLCVPTGISKISIHPIHFLENLSSPPIGRDPHSVIVNYDSEGNVIKSRGIEIEGLEMTKMSTGRSQDLPSVISHHAFYPFKNSEAQAWGNDKSSTLLPFVAIVMENLASVTRTPPKILELCSQGVRSEETLDMVNVIRTHFAKPDVDYALAVDGLSSDLAETFRRNMVKTQNLQNVGLEEWKCGKSFDLIVMDDKEFVPQFLSILKTGGFLILKSPLGTCSEAQLKILLETCTYGYHFIAQKSSPDHDLFLIRKDTNLETKDVEVICVNSSVTWVDSLAVAMRRQEKLLQDGSPCPRLYLVSMGDQTRECGLLGLTLCIRKEPYSQNVRSIFSKRPMQLDFGKPDEMLQKILDQDLVFNVFDDSGQLGCYVHSEAMRTQSETSTNVEKMVQFSPKKSYIVLGGLGGVGLELINWMTLRNAHHILVTSRSNRLTPYARSYLKIWKERGVEVRVLFKNGVYLDEAHQILKEAMDMAPIGGIFNLTLQLEVNLTRNQTAEAFQKVIDPKITMTQNFDDLSRKLCPELDHFVIFSSMSAAVGFDGQGNYAFANSGAERLVERRMLDGFPARAIQWGPIGEVGAWHSQFNKEFERTEFHGAGIQSIRSVLEDLDILLTLPGPPVTFCRKPVNLEGCFETDAKPEEVNVIERIAHILGHSSAAKLNISDKLVELGLDSIISIEVTQMLKTDFDLELSAAEIRSYTLEQLVQMSANGGRHKRGGIANESCKDTQVNPIIGSATSEFHEPEPELDKKR